MEEQILQQLYREYLSDILEVDKKSNLSDRDVAKEMRRNLRIMSFAEGEDEIIYDTKTGEVTGKIRHVKVKDSYPLPGVVKVVTKNELYKTFDSHGKEVIIKKLPNSPAPKYAKTLPVIFRDRKVFDDEYVFYNDALNSYETALYSPLYFIISYDYGPHDDFRANETIELESNDFILFASEDLDVYFYRKAIGTYEKLEYDKRENLQAEFNINKDLIKLNNTYYYVTPYEVINVTHIMKDVHWHTEITIKQLTEKIISFAEFKKLALSNKDFVAQLKEVIKEEKTKKAAEDLREAKRIEEEENHTRINNRKKEIFKSIKSLLVELDGLNKELTQDDYLDIDPDIIFIDKGDHKEINPLFVNYLSSIDLSSISFANVKISGIDLSNTNALIDPQEVYKKDMSNGNYSGLDFNVANFSGVDIRNSVFTDCIMDFTVLSGAIMDENTILPEKRKVASL